MLYRIKMRNFLFYLADVGQIIDPVSVTHDFYVSNGICTLGAMHLKMDAAVQAK